VNWIKCRTQSSIQQFDFATFTRPQCKPGLQTIEALVQAFIDANDITKCVDMKSILACMHFFIEEWENIIPATGIQEDLNEKFEMYSLTGLQQGQNPYNGQLQRLFGGAAKLLATMDLYHALEALTRYIQTVEQMRDRCKLVLEVVLYPKILRRLFARFFNGPDEEVVLAYAGKEYSFMPMQAFAERCAKNKHCLFCYDDHSEFPQKSVHMLYPLSHTLTGVRLWGAVNPNRDEPKYWDLWANCLMPCPACIAENLTPFAKFASFFNFYAEHQHGCSLQKCSLGFPGHTLPIHCLTSDPHTCEPLRDMLQVIAANPHLRTMDLSAAYSSAHGKRRRPTYHFALPVGSNPVALMPECAPLAKWYTAKIPVKRKPAVKPKPDVDPKPAVKPKPAVDPKQSVKPKQAVNPAVSAVAPPLAGLAGFTLEPLPTLELHHWHVLRAESPVDNTPEVAWEYLPASAVRAPSTTPVVASPRRSPSGRVDIAASKRSPPADGTERPRKKTARQVSREEEARKAAPPASPQRESATALIASAKSSPAKYAGLGVTGEEEAEEGGELIFTDYAEDDDVIFTDYAGTPPYCYYCQGAYASPQAMENHRCAPG
jgi:hypothetical protein